MMPILKSVVGNGQSATPYFLPTAFYRLPTDREPSNTANLLILYPVHHLRLNVTLGQNTGKSRPGWAPGQADDQTFLWKWLMCNATILFLGYIGLMVLVLRTLYKDVILFFLKMKVFRVQSSFDRDNGCQYYVTTKIQV